MYARKMPAIVAVPLMALAMAIVAGVPARALGGIVVDGASALSKAYVAVMFGALLGRVTLDTGIARSIVSLAAEYGGENPFGFALVLCGVVAVLFTTLSGLGAIIMVGTIVLPVMMTTGVPRTVAATLFLMAFALGFIFNIANWTFYTTFFGVHEQQLVRYAIALAIIDAFALVSYAWVAFRRERDYAAWATASEPQEFGVPWWSLATPVLPILLYFALHLEATPAFALSAAFGAVTTRPREAVKVLVAAAIRGIEDVAPAVVLFMGIGMLLVATREPQFAAALRPVAEGRWIQNPFAFVLVFGFFSPLALYRGPLNPFGVGIAVFSVLLASHAAPPVVLVAAVMALVQVQNVCDPTNTQNVWVANFTGVPIVTITKRTLPFQVAVAIAATIAIVLGSGQLLGTRAFASLVMPAYAGPYVPGMDAPPEAARRVAVDDDGTALGRVSADAVVKAIAGNAGLKPFRYHDQPNDTDCLHKPYAAYIRMVTSTFALTEGTDLDVGLVLEDCGGWIAQEWHDHAVFSYDPRPDDARAIALQAVPRMLRWAAFAPDAAYLFQRGISISPNEPPNYYYALFKTSDGNMRAYVRAGGPAYRAGMRTGDVIDDIDGLAWWNYGTYPAQQFSYDGKPHAFRITRNGRTLNVDLSTVEPYAP